MSIFEYNAEQHIAMEKEESWNEGRNEGLIQKLVEQIIKKVRKNKSLEVIADELEVDENEVRNLLLIVNKYAPTYDIDLIMGEVIGVDNEVE